MPAAAEHFRHASFWTGRTLRTALAAAVLLLLIRVGWGWHLSSKVRAQLDAARARGEATTAAEVSLSAPAPGQNAWDLHTRAMNATIFGVDSPRSSNLEYTSYPPYGPKWLKLAEGSEARHGPAFALARQARAHPLARARDTFDPDPKAMMVNGLNSARNLANLLADSAQFLETRGQYAEAAERFRDVLHLARSLRQDPVLVSQLVALGLEALACGGIQIAAPGLRAGARDPATRKAITGLIADLLDEGAARDGFRAAAVAERIVVTHMLRTAGDQRLAIRPLADRQIAFESANAAVVAEAVAADTWPAAELILTRIKTEPAIFGPGGAWAGIFGTAPAAPFVPRYSRWFHWGFGEFYGKGIEKQIQGLAERRITAVALAMQLYYADHNRWPTRLADLVPTYLPAVPRDPYRAAAPEVGYVTLPKGLPDGTDRPLIYVEPGPVDSQDVNQWKQPMYGWQQGTINGLSARVPIRQYRDVTRFRPADVKINEDGDIGPAPGGGFGSMYAPPPPPVSPTPSTPGVDDDPDKPDAPRKGEHEQPDPDAPKHP
ncbi:MAG TPA: hypothetical protein VEA69_02645 [Tepidisphaeraceae bacterium]|nr:hypothetical protein [Tepidisphaeraceae bacterium]